MCEIPWWVSGKESACQAGDWIEEPGGLQSMGLQKSWT